MTTSTFIFLLVAIIVVLVVLVAVLLWLVFRSHDELQRKNEVIIREVQKNVHLQDELRESWQKNANRAAVL